MYQVSTPRFEGKKNVAKGIVAKGSMAVEDWRRTQETAVDW